MSGATLARALLTGLAALLVALSASLALGPTLARAQEGGTGGAGEPATSTPEGPKGGLRELAPSWARGLQWVVLSHPIVFSLPTAPGADERPHRDLEKTIQVRFEVHGVKDVDGNACHEVAVTSDHRPQDELTLLVRTQDRSLKQLRRRRGPSGPESVIANGRTPFVSFETGALCPCDFPLFPRDTGNEERTFDLGEGRAVRQTITVDKDRNVHVVLATKIGGEELVSTQDWKAGLPFWSKATRTLGGHLEDSAELDEKSLKRENAGDAGKADGPQAPRGK